MSVTIDCSKGLNAAKMLAQLLPEQATGDFEVFAQADAKMPTKTLEVVQRFIGSLGLSSWALEEALSVFDVLAWAESKAHDCTIEDVHFHEVGSFVNIMRVMMCFSLLDQMDSHDWQATPPALGNGTVHCAHGELSVPAPATRRIIERYQIPVLDFDYGCTFVGELTTPTGAALLTRASKMAT